MACGTIFDVGYNMKADLLKMDAGHPVRDESGEIVRTPDKWVPDKTIDCMARAAKGTGVRFTPSREEWLEQGYKDEEFVMLFTKERVSKRYRVTNIKDSEGNLAWTNDDGTATLFNVNGSIPFFDPFGNIIQYQIVLARVDNSG